MILLTLQDKAKFAFFSYSYKFFSLFNDKKS